MGKDYTQLKSRDKNAFDSQNRSLWSSKGDTLYSISKKYNLVTELKQINNLSANTISIGQRLKVK
jgi:hypothetical protein